MVCVPASYAPPQSGGLSPAQSARCRPHPRTPESRERRTCGTESLASATPVRAERRLCPCVAPPGIAIPPPPPPGRRAPPPPPPVTGCSVSQGRVAGAGAPLVNHLLVFVLQKVALLLLPGENDSADLTHRASLLLGGVGRVPLGQPDLALAADQQDEVNHAARGAAERGARAAE